jgi:parallel beta-helix repeat protein
MSIKRNALVTAVLVAFAGLVLPGAGPAQGQASPVTTCGQTLGAPGVYQLVGDLGPCPGDGVTITSSGVTLDLAGFTISGDPAACISPFGTGINIQGPVSNVLVSGGTVVGFLDGVGVYSATDSRITNVTTMNPCRLGIYVENSRRVKLIENTVTGAGFEGVRFDFSSARVLLKSTKISGSFADAVFIAPLSNRNKIKRNQINGNGNGVAILAEGNKILGNTVNGNASGIFLGPPASGNIIRGNTTNGNDSGIFVNSDATGNLIESNTAQNNGRADLEDRNPGCDANTWSANTFVTDLVDLVSDGGPGVGCIQ